MAVVLVFFLLVFSLSTGNAEIFSAVDVTNVAYISCGWYTLSYQVRRRITQYVMIISSMHLPYNACGLCVNVNLA